MIDIEKNKRINNDLSKLYEQVTEKTLEAYRNCFSEDDDPPKRINEFGIIDVEQYDGDKGVLCVLKETAGWDNASYEKGDLFRSWMYNITKNGFESGSHVSRHPLIWYNLGRWIMLLNDPKMDIQELVYEKDKAREALATVAITNLNKVRGGSYSGDSYKKMIEEGIVLETLQEEIEALSPRYIICCGTADVVKKVKNFVGKIIEMRHTTARIGAVKMLDRIKEHL